MSEGGRPSNADPRDFHPRSKAKIRVLTSLSRRDFAVAYSHLADLCRSLSALMRAGLVLSLLPDTATSPEPTVAVEQEWEREEDWQRLFM